MPLSLMQSHAAISSLLVVTSKKRQTAKFPSNCTAPEKSYTNQVSSHYVTFQCRTTLTPFQGTKTFADGKVLANDVNRGRVHRKHVPTKSNVGSKSKTMMKQVPKSNFSKPKRTQTSKPMTKEEACTFSLTIFLSKADNFWYLGVMDSTDSRCTGGTIGHHHGHARVSPDLIISKSTRIAPDNLELLGHCEQSGMSCAATAKLLKDRSSDRFTAAQVNYLLQKRLTRKANSADEMIADFEER